MTWMIYGANGFTGQLLAQLARERGEQPILAGRRADAVRAVAEELGLSWRAFALNEPGAVDEGLSDVESVVHCAGPFSTTSESMVHACLRTCTSYLDITGELDVFEAIHLRDEDARRAGIVLLPGVGYDVVPSDCLAVAVAAALPGATELDLAFDGIHRPSRGTARTAVEGLARGGRVRRDGVIVEVPLASHTCEVPFARGKRTCITIPWGDVSTAYHSTGIGNIRVFAPLARQAIFALRASRSLLGLPPVQALLKGLAGRLRGPDEEERRSLRAQLWAEARGPGGRVSGTLEVPETYQLTVECALECLRRVSAGALAPGAWTPASAFGAGLITEVCGSQPQLSS
jgi:saccharopine dehydrogenase (NAD+, L-lysine-forming)